MECPLLDAGCKARPKRGGEEKLYLSQIETGKRKGSTGILSALAKALNVTLEEVIAREAE